MQRIPKTVNKFSGNFCFAADTDFGNIVVECEWRTGTLSYDYSSKPVTDVCLLDSVSYLVSFSDNWLGKYSSGTLNETYINTGIASVDGIATNKSGNIYILDRTNNVLHKYGSWNITLPDYSSRSYGKIVVKEADGTIVYSNNEKVYVVRDDTTQATIINSLEISGSGDISTVVSNGYSPTFTYARVRWTTDIEQSSSSSSSSSESSESSSSVSSESSSSVSSSSVSSESSESSSSVSSDSSSSSKSSSSNSSSSYSSPSSDSSSSHSSSSNSSSSYSSSSSSSYINMWSSSSSSSSSLEGTKWVMADSTPSGYTLRSVAWSPYLGKFVAVSGPVLDKCVMSSTDGKNWHPSDITNVGSNLQWQSVCWSPELSVFVAVARNDIASTYSQIMTSPDGETWTRRTNPGGHGVLIRAWESVCWSPYLGKFVAVASPGLGADKLVMTSTDGNTWSTAEASLSTFWSDVTWSNSLGLFTSVAISFAGGENQIMTSANGTGWVTQTTASVSNCAYRSLCWSDDLSKFVSVGYSGTNRVWTSSNAVNWANAASASETTAWNAVCRSEDRELFVAVGDATGDITKEVMTSPDGTTWTLANAAADYTWTSVCWSPELKRFVAVSTDGYIMTSG